VTIDTLPSVALLGIFGFYLSAYGPWHKLVHVCRRWRNIVFRSSHLLNLQITCSYGRPVRAALDIWPPLPIEIFGYEHRKKGSDVDNIVAALEHRDRVCAIILWDISSSNLGKILAAMGEPFLALTSLELQWGDGETATKVARGPDSFLGGSAPRLIELTLNGIPLPFLGLQKLLLSANDLVDLRLQKISHSFYFSPDAILTVLSALTKLETLDLRFKSPRSRPVRESRRSPPPTRPSLPSLTSITFKGVNEYLEDIVAQINAPLLNRLSITFFHQLTFDTRQLAQLIARAPKLKGHNEARVVFSEYGVRVTLLLPSQAPPEGEEEEEEITLGVQCKHPDLQLLSVTQLCTVSFPSAFISRVEHLCIAESKYLSTPRWENNIQKRQWLKLLRPFTAVRDLYLSEKIVPLIAPALGKLVGSRVTEVLPALQCLFLEGLHTSGPVLEAVSPFIDARRLSTHPIAASCWDRELGEWWESFDDGF
jgi:hypothetical protein